MHVVLECYSVLTRLPFSQHLRPADAAATLDAMRTETVSLPAAATTAVIAELAAHDVGGGAIFDALIAATARQHGLTLLTRDRRAQRTYDALRVPHMLV